MSISIPETYVQLLSPGTGPTHLDEVECRGDETDILDCPAIDWWLADCQHYEDAGVFCRESCVDITQYRKTSCISRTKYQNLNVSYLVLQSSLPNPLKPGVKSSTKM